MRPINTRGHSTHDLAAGAEDSPVPQDGPQLSSETCLHQHVQIFTVLKRPVQPEHTPNSTVMASTEQTVKATRP